MNDSGDGVDSGSGDKKYGGSDTDTLGKEPYQFRPTGAIDTLTYAA